MCQLFKELAASLVVLATLTTAALAEDDAASTASESPPDLTASAVDLSDQVPPRTDALSAITLSDEDLWRRIEQDHTVVVGLKAPGKNRGVWRDQVLVSEVEWDAAKKAVSDIPGVTLIEANPDLPFIVVTVPDAETLKRIRQLPTVDYVEPNRILSPLSGPSSGCGVDPWIPPVSRIPDGDFYPWNYEQTPTAPYYLDHFILKAWNRFPSNRVAGGGVTIGVLDTGVYGTQSQLFSPAFTSPPYGSSRSVSYFSGLSGSPDMEDRCNHGTRMEMTAAAPRDGKSMVGVAFKSNLIIGKVTNNPIDWQASDVANGILRITNFARKPGVPGAQIVAMAFGSLDDKNSVADAIRAAYSKLDVLFIAAAGTPPGCQVPGTQNGVVFPGRMLEVVTVSATPQQGASRQGCVGPEVDVAPIVGPDVPANGSDANQLIHFGGSSAGTALTSGIAAMIWSRYPTCPPQKPTCKIRDEVQHRLYDSGGYGRWVNNELGWGIPNAYGAIGGFYRLDVQGPLDGRVEPRTRYRLTAVPRGEGPWGEFIWQGPGVSFNTQSIEYTSGATGTDQVWIITAKDLTDQTVLQNRYTVHAKSECLPPACP